MEKVVLVDPDDKVMGEMEKIQAHKEGILHRAFSIFVFNTQGEVLLQKRASHKYHSPGLWTNTCCSHPRPGESVLEAAYRRLKEEMGMATRLERKFSFLYKAEFENGLTEHELDHVLFGYSDDKPILNPDEVEDFKYIPMEALTQDIEKHPENYTVWLKHCLNKVLKEKANFTP